MQGTFCQIDYRTSCLRRITVDSSQPVMRFCQLGLGVKSCLLGGDGLSGSSHFGGVLDRRVEQSSKKGLTVHFQAKLDNNPLTKSWHDRVSFRWSRATCFLQASTNTGGDKSCFLLTITAPGIYRRVSFRSGSRLAVIDHKYAVYLRQALQAIQLVPTSKTTRTE